MHSETELRARRLIVDRLKRYHYPPRTKLTREILSEELGIGVTPIGAALKLIHWEGMITHKRKGGYFVKPPLASDIRGLIWNTESVLSGIIAHVEDDPTWLDHVDLGDLPARDIVTPETDKQYGAFIADLTGNVFSLIARLSASDIIDRTIETMNNRLYFMRSLEWEILGDTSPDISAMIEHLQSGDFANLRTSIVAYHKKRSDNLHRLVELVCLQANRPDDTRRSA